LARALATARDRPADKPQYGSESGFPTKKAALAYGNDQEAAIRAKTWRDPKRAAIALDAYWAEWIAAQDISQRTVDGYSDHYRVHISPRFGHKAIGDVTALAVDAWEKDLRSRRSASTVNGIMVVLRMMMADAVEDGRITISPVRQKRRRGRRTAPAEPVGVAVELETVEAIRRRLPAPEALLVLIVVFTGMRRGEAMAMRRRYLRLEPADGATQASGFYDIDKDDGAVHEDRRGRRYFAPEGAQGPHRRAARIPGVLLLAYLETVPADRDLLFPDGTGQPWRRSNFDRQLWRPACDGWPVRRATRNHPGRQGARPSTRACGCTTCGTRTRRG